MTRIRTFLWIAAAAIALLSFAGTPNAAVNTWMNGLSCVDGNSTLGSIKWSLGNGAYNSSSSTWKYVLCPISGSEEDFYEASGSVVYYRDGNNTNNSYGNLYCYSYAIDKDSDVTLGGVRYSCSSPSGCTSPDYDYYSTAGNYDYLVVPAPSATYIAGFTLQCRLPQDDEDYSSIVGYYTGID